MSSSPFEIFRNNLKPLMVFLTLLALFSFVVLPALDTYMRRGGGMNSNPVAATFDGTELTRTRVDRTTQNHRAVVRFLYELAGLTLKRKGVPQTPGFQFDEQSGQIRAIGIDANPSNEATIHTLRFYHEAQKAGFELDDVQLKDWLTRFSDGTVSDNEIAELLMRSSDRQLGPQHLYEQLRMHLLADLYQRGAIAGLSAGQMPIVTPLGQWENFLKLNQQATVSAYGVLVSEYFDKTNKDPSKSDIEDIYNTGRERMSIPGEDAPVAGFRRPDSAQIEYVFGNMQQFIDVEKTKLSEKQLRDEYERRLTGGDFQVPADLTDQSGAENTDETPAADPSSGENDNSAPSAVTAPTEPAAASEEPSSPEAPAAQTQTPKPAEGDSSLRRHANPAVQLVALQDEESVTEVDDATEPESATKPEPPASETPAEPKTPAEPETPAEPQTPPEPETPAETEAPAKPEAPAEPAMSTEPEAAADTQPPAEQPAEPMKTLDLGDEPAPTKSQSFEDVRDQIATELASGPARITLDKAVTEANNRMRDYFSKLAIHESNVAVGVQTEADAPPRLDLQKMAKELGLQYGKTNELVNQISVEKIAPGRSSGLGSGMNRSGPPYSAMMFGAAMQDGSMLPAQPVFSPLRSVDFESGVTYYISWKTKDVASYIPKLDEVRDEVIRFIRMGEARKLAQAAAEKIVAAMGDGKNLVDVVPADKKANIIENVGPFSWLEQVGFMQTVPAEVPELDAVGDDFMRAVFTTEVGKYTVAANDPQSVYYVVTPNEFQPDVERLREQFRQPQQRFMAQMLGSEDARNLIRGYLQSVDARTGFKMSASDDE